MKLSIKEKGQKEVCDQRNLPWKRVVYREGIPDGGEGKKLSKPVPL